MNSLITSLKISTRVALISGFSVISFLALLAWIKLNVADSLFDAKREQTQRLVETAWSITDGIANQPGISTEEAKKQAQEAIRHIRYDTSNYIWIQDINRPTLLMHPIKPEIQGKSFAGVKGFEFIQEAIDIVKKDGAGVVTYQWDKEGNDVMVNKTSYVKGYPKFGWIFGTGVYVDDVEDQLYDLTLTVLSVVVAVLLVIVVLSWVVIRSINVPLAIILASLKDIASGEGDLTKRVEITSKDELAEVSSWFNRFIETLQSLIAEIGATTQGIASSSEKLSFVSSQLNDAAQDSSAKAISVSGSAEEVSVSISTVASAVEEMSSTIQEISNNASHAAKVANDLSVKAESTTQTIQSLDASSTEIGEILNLISSIAEQTNLLALNATIEAARAGDAGKGFAVVANEVKELAKETASATDSIGQKIARMQDDSKSAVSAVVEIKNVIEEVTTVSNTMASAVEEQTATTHEISKNVEEVAKGGAEISESISAVASAAKVSEDGASEIKGSANELASFSETLQKLVGQFRY